VTTQPAAARAGDDTHRRLLSEHVLDEIFQENREAKVSKNLTLHCKRTMYVLENCPLNRAIAGKRVQVLEDEDGQVTIRFQGRMLQYSAFPKHGGAGVTPGDIVANKYLAGALSLIRRTALRAREAGGAGNDTRRLPFEGTPNSPAPTTRGTSLWQMRRRLGVDEPWQSSRAARRAHPEVPIARLSLLREAGAAAGYSLVFVDDRAAFARLCYEAEQLGAPRALAQEADAKPGSGQVALGMSVAALHPTQGDAGPGRRLCHPSRSPPPIPARLAPPPCVRLRRMPKIAAGGRLPFMLSIPAAGDVEPRAQEDHFVRFRGATWADYQRALELRGERAAPRITFLEGLLEIMTPSRDHESIKSIIGCLVEVWCLERDIEFNTCGSWTLEDKELERGAEPDECYVFGPRGAERSRPDLAIEVVWTSGGLNKLEVYRKLGVPELWYWRHGKIQIYSLRGERYEQLEQSEKLPGIDLVQLASFLDEPSTSQAIRAYRAALQRT
jgi:Uma2 family endonuclease